MKSVFFIEQEKFLRDMVELIFKDNELDVYTIDSAQDCLYLIKDLSPDLVIVDLDTLAPNLELFLRGLELDNISTPLLALGSEKKWEELKEFRSRFIGLELKPLASAGLIDRLSKYC